MTNLEETKRLLKISVERDGLSTGSTPFEVELELALAGKLPQKLANEVRWIEDESSQALKSWIEKEFASLIEDWNEGIKRRAIDMVASGLKFQNNQSSTSMTAGKIQLPLRVNTEGFEFLLKEGFFVVDVQRAWVSIGTVDSNGIVRCPGNFKGLFIGKGGAMIKKASQILGKRLTIK